MDCGQDGRPNLVALEGLVSQDLSCKLEEVKDGIAQVRVAGTVNGIDLGVDVKITVQASYQFNVPQKRLTFLSWKQKDVRDQGPACPALVADVEQYVVLPQHLDGWSCYRNFAFIPFV